MLSLRQACVRATPWLVGAGRTPAVTSKVAFVSARAVSSTAWIAAPVPHPVQAGNSCEIFNRLALTPSADVAWGAALCQLPTVDAVRMYHPAKKGRPGGPKRSAKKPTYNNNEHRHKPKWPKFNNAVTANTVRVLDAAGEQIGVMPRASALSYAKERHLDLVQFSDMNEPVVCKVMDWHKEQRAMRQRANARKREAAQREREASNKKMKRMQFTARIEDHDLHVKTMKMQRMLEKGHGIKVTIAFQGPEAWRIQEEKRRAVVGRLMDDIGETALWDPNTLKADSYQLHLQIRPNSTPNQQSEDRARMMREKLRNPIWPAAVAKAEAVRKGQEAAAAKKAARVAAQEAAEALEDDLGDEAFALHPKKKKMHGKKGKKKGAVEVDVDSLVEDVAYDEGASRP